MTVIVSALIGALAGVSSGLFVEAYRRHRDRKGVASALAGEIAAILTMTARRRHVQAFGGIVEQLQAGTDVPIPVISTGEPKLDPVIEKNLDKLGALGGNLPERVANFHQVLQGIRLDLFRLSRPEARGQREWKLNLLREDLALWQETEANGRQLVQDLQAIAAPKLWGFW